MLIEESYWYKLILHYEVKQCLSLIKIWRPRTRLRRRPRTRLRPRLVRKLKEVRKWPLSSKSRHRKFSPLIDLASHSPADCIKMLMDIGYWHTELSTQRSFSVLSTHRTRRGTRTERNTQRKLINIWVPVVFEWLCLCASNSVESPLEYSEKFN